jgi:hypothetical protein
MRIICGMIASHLTKAVQRSPDRVILDINRKFGECNFELRGQIMIVYLFGLDMEGPSRLFLTF